MRDSGFNRSDARVVASWVAAKTELAAVSDSRVLSKSRYGGVDVGRCVAAFSGTGREMRKYCTVDRGRCW
jgi:hypothetical protein